LHTTPLWLVFARDARDTFVIDLYRHNGRLLVGVGGHGVQLVVPPTLRDQRDALL